MPLRSPVVVNWLAEAGLSAYSSGFENLSVDDFKSLLMQDYGKYGVTDMDSKQRLFRLIKRVSSEDTSYPAPKRANASPAPDAKGLLGNAGLLDLEAHDSSLLSEVHLRPECVETPAETYLTFSLMCSTGTVLSPSSSWTSSGSRPCAAWSQWTRSSLICCSICRGQQPTKDPGGCAQAAPQQQGAPLLSRYC